MKSFPNRLTLFALIILPFALLTVLAGCSAPTPAPDSQASIPPGTDPCENPYLPFQSNTHLEYASYTLNPGEAVSGGGLVTKYDVLTMPAGSNEYRGVFNLTEADGRTFTMLYACQPDGIASPFSPSPALPPVDQLKIDTAWSVDIPARALYPDTPALSTIYQYRVAGYEQVETPAGPVRALRIDNAIRYSPDPWTESSYVYQGCYKAMTRWSYWYAWGVGLIREEKGYHLLPNDGSQNCRASLDDEFITGDVLQAYSALAAVAPEMAQSPAEPTATSAPLPTATLVTPPTTIPSISPFEAQVRYIIADIQLGDVKTYYETYRDQPAVDAALCRWDLGQRVENIREFARRSLPDVGWKVIDPNTGLYSNSDRMQMTPIDTSGCLSQIIDPIRVSPGATSITTVQGPILLPAGAPLRAMWIYAKNMDTGLTYAKMLEAGSPPVFSINVPSPGQYYLFARTVQYAQGAYLTVDGANGSQEACRDCGLASLSLDGYADTIPAVLDFNVDPGAVPQPEGSLQPEPRKIEITEATPTAAAPATPAPAALAKISGTTYYPTSGGCPGMTIYAVDLDRGQTYYQRVSSFDCRYSIFLPQPARYYLFARLDDPDPNNPAGMYRAGGSENINWVCSECQPDILNVAPGADFSNVSIFFYQFNPHIPASFANLVPMPGEADQVSRPPAAVTSTPTPLPPRQYYGFPIKVPRCPECGDFIPFIRIYFVHLETGHRYRQEHAMYSSDDIALTQTEAGQYYFIEPRFILEPGNYHIFAQVFPARLPEGQPRIYTFAYTGCETLKTNCQGSSLKTITIPTNSTDYILVADESHYAEAPRPFKNKVFLWFTNPNPTLQGTDGCVVTVNGLVQDDPKPVTLDWGDGVVETGFFPRSHDYFISFISEHKEVSIWATTSWYEMNWLRVDLSKVCGP